MANIDLNFNGLTKLKDWWGVVKSNFSAINTQLEDHVDGTADRHNAEDIDFSSLRPTITADDVLEAIEEVDERIDGIVNNPDPNKDLELVDLRTSSVYGAFATAKERCDNSDVAINDHGANVTRLGVTGDGVVDDTADFLTVITNNDNVFIPEEVTVLTDMVTLSGRDITIKGAGPDVSVIKARSVDAALFNCTDCNITFENIKLDCSAVDIGGLYNIGTLATAKKKVQLLNCVIDVSGSLLKNAVDLTRYHTDVRIKNCTLIGNPAATTSGVENYQAQCLFITRDDGLNIGDDTPYWIQNNKFLDGAVALNISGTDAPPSPFYFQNNLCDGQTYMGARLYHGEELVFTGNIFQNITNVLSPTPNNDGAVVWLDIYSPTVAGTENSSIFSDNTIRNCVGNAVYAEELVGAVIEGFKIMSIAKRPVGQEYVGTTGYSSLGGNGILIGGACIGTFITGCRVSRCESYGILVDRTITVKSTDRIHLSIEGCTIFNNEEHGIGGHDQIRTLTITNCKIYRNSLSAEGVYSAIYITRHGTSTQSLGHIKILGNDFYVNDEAQSQKHNYEKSYSGGTVIIAENILDSTEELISCASISGYITDNVFRNFTIGPIDTSGSNYIVRNNKGYILERGISVSITGSGTVTHLLDETPNYIVATVEGTVGNFAQVSNITSTTFDVNVFRINSGVIEAEPNPRTVHLHVSNGQIYERA